MVTLPTVRPQQAACGVPQSSVPSSCLSCRPCSRPFRNVPASKFASMAGRGLQRGLQVAQFSRARQQVCVAASSATASDTELVDPSGFRIEQISFGKILSPIGIGLMTYGFGAFFGLLPGGDVSSIMLVYGFPISLLGFALAYAQLKPVPCKTTRAAFNLRDSQMTDIQKQLREDVTRYRYGDEQHLDESLGKIFMFNRAKGIAKRLTPILTGVREEVVDDKYTLVLEFRTRKEMTMEMWTDRQDKIQTFFGPGVQADIQKTNEGVDVYLKSDGSGAGRGGAAQKDVMPPLMPGLKARQNKQQ
ncbi:hypothetical protein ABBQ38_011826 [Trebouxia sp. C0009 RCD-2024]